MRLAIRWSDDQRTVIHCASRAISDGNLVLRVPGAADIIVPQRLFRLAWPLPDHEDSE